MHLFVLTEHAAENIQAWFDAMARGGGPPSLFHRMVWQPTAYHHPVMEAGHWDHPPTDEQLGQIMGSIDAHLDLLERYPSAGTTREQGCDDCLSGEWPARHLTTDRGMVGPPCWCHNPKGDQQCHT